MAGTIIADYIRADANKISLNVGNTIVASINASGILSNTGSVIISPTGALGSGIVLDRASIPAGTIIQARAAYSNTVITATSGGAAQEVVGLDFTPYYSNSYIVVIATSGQIRRTGWSTSTNNWANFRIQIAGENAISPDGVSNGGSQGALGYPISVQDYRFSVTTQVYSTSWSGSKRVRAAGSMGSSEGSINFCYQNDGAYITVLEIKQ